MKKKQIILILSMLFVLILIMVLFMWKRRESSISDDSLSKKEASQPISYVQKNSPSIPIKVKKEQISIDPFADLEPSTPVLALLYGRVTDIQGNPIPQTKITIRSNYSFWIFPEVITSTLTDENGEYRFDSLPVETIQVLAEKDEYFLEHAKISFVARFLSIEKNFILSKGGLPLGGMVQDKKDNAIPGAMVRLFIPGSLLTFAQTTDEKGAFCFNGLWNAPANLSVLASGFVAWFGSDFAIGTQDMKIVLSREGGTKIKGIVYTNDSKTPVSNAIVIAQGFNLGVPFFAVISQENGLYEMGPLIPGKYFLNASKNYQYNSPSFNRMIELVEGGGDQVWMDLFLPELYDIRGCVVDEDDNSPVSGAIVHVSGTTVGNHKIFFPGSPFVLSDDQGRFRIQECKAPDSSYPYLTIWVDAAGYVDNYARIEKVTKLTPPVTIKLKKGIHFYGTIFSDTGESVTNAFWELRLITGISEHNFFNRYTDSTGGFDEMIASEWASEKASIYAYSPEYGFSLESIEFPESGNELKHDITLTPGIPVTVIVLDKEGNGIKDCRIEAYTSKKNEYNFTRKEFTDSEGEVYFKNLPRFLFSFTASHQEFKPYKSKDLDLTGVKEPQQLVFSLDDPEEIKYVIYGSVMDNKGKALSDVKVEQRYDLPSYSTDSEGKYRIEITKSNIHELTFSKKGFGKVIKQIDREKDAKEIEINAVLEEQEPFILFGSIIGEKGDIPTEVEIQIFMSEKEKNIKWGYEYRWISLKPGGTFEIEPLQYAYREGISYSIGARHSIYGAGYSEEIVAETRRRLGPFDIELYWGILKGYVRDSKTGQNIGDVLISTHELNRSNIRYFDSNDISINIRSDKNGYFELSPLSFGNTDIYFYHPEYWIQKKTSPEISEEHLEIEWNPVLDQKARLMGKIYRSDGTPLVDASVTVANSDFFQNEKTDEKGNYSIKGIPSGKYNMYHTMDSDPAKGEYRNVMKREIDISEPATITCDIHIPECIPVTLEVNKFGWVYFDPLFPSEYKSIQVNMIMEVIEGRGLSWLTVPLPPGRFLLRTGPDQTSREIEIIPGRENRFPFE